MYTLTEKIVHIWKLRDLRKNILYVLLMLVIFRFAAHIPVPGIDREALRDFFAGNQFLGLLNIFSGGGMENFSVVALGIAPFITSSIIFQLLAMVVPSLEELSKEGEYGRQKINQYTRWLTVPLAALQGYGLIAILRNQTNAMLGNISALQLGGMLITLTAGTIFLMWIGELISGKHVGNGISLLIFAGIVASLPTIIQRNIVTFDPTRLTTMLIFTVIAVITVVGVVIITEGQRNVPVSYAKRVRGTRMFGGVDTHLPLRVNMAGVIPIIFAISLILFPPMIAQFFLRSTTTWVAALADNIMALFNNQLIYGILYFVLVFGFTYFYTAVIFHPDQIAENLQKQGGFIPGIRPGKPTADYLGYTINRILLAGALFLGLIAILPLITQRITGTQALVIGGTSLLIVVSVVIETVKQIQSQLTMHDYERM